jgi:DNA repair exonuclease SbcCD ATPase subunit
MSQTETLMLIALGFALAFIVVLLFGRGVWNMAMRLGARRQAKQIPVAMLELQADRDRLRADHAMMARKLELRLEDIKTRMTEQMAEVSRHRNRVQSMMADLERRDETIKIRDREVAALNAQLEVSKADLAACYDTIEKLTAEGTNKETQLSKQAALIGQISNSLREKNSMVSNLGQELQTALRVSEKALPVNAGAPSTENRLLKRVAELTSISTQMSSQNESNIFTPKLQINDSTMHPPMETSSRQASLDQQLAETERESAAMAEQLKALDAMMAPAIKPAPEPMKKSGAMANVISLAQRIRALQKINE